MRTWAALTRQGVYFARRMAFDKTAKGTADGLGAFSAKLMVLGKCEGSDIDFDALERCLGPGRVGH